MQQHKIEPKSKYIIYVDFNKIFLRKINKFIHKFN